MKKNKKSGFFLIEIIVASAIISTSLVFILSALGNTLSLSRRGLEETQASYLLEEGVEATKAIRNQSWTTISNAVAGNNESRINEQNEENNSQRGQQTSNSKYLVWTNGVNGNPGSWSLSNSSQTIGNFTRTLFFSNVYRDANDRIVNSGGTLDSGTVRVDVTVSWPTLNSTKVETLPFYITNISM